MLLCNQNNQTTNLKLPEDEHFQETGKQKLNISAAKSRITATLQRHFTYSADEEHVTPHEEYH